MPRKKTGEKTTISEELVKKLEDVIFSANTYVNMAIYAILEAPQELHFGLRTERNVNLLETVTIDIGGRRPVTKPYLSPTKMRGIERRAIAYSVVESNNKSMPYYKYFRITIDLVPFPPDPRDILTFLWGATWTEPTAYIRGRVAYGGGVGVQINIERKERNRVPYNHLTYIGSRGESEKSEQMIFAKDYVEPHVLIPVVRYGYLLGYENYEPHALAYAFLQGLRITGAGTPKGLQILEAYWKNEEKPEPVLVVDIGSNLLYEPVTVSPALLDPYETVMRFKEKALSVKEAKFPENVDNVFKDKGVVEPMRFTGKNALKLLNTLAVKFKNEYLEKIDEVDIPRARVLSKQ